MPDMPSELAEDAVALRLCRGARRLLWSIGYATLTEVPLANGRRADIFGIAGNGEIVIVEIKSSIADFRSDQKWTEYREYCDLFYFAVGEDFPSDLIPETSGLILADAFGAAIARQSQNQPLAGARRKSLTAKFGQLAAGRLHRLQDPMLGML